MCIPHTFITFSRKRISLDIPISLVYSYSFKSQGLFVLNCKSKSRKDQVGFLILLYRQ